MTIKKECLGHMAFSNKMGKAIVINEENKSILLNEKGLKHIFNADTKKRTDKPDSSDSEGNDNTGKS